ncbi:hypothetical protein I8748_04365 [Nostoc sp. CENA67]|uniref:Uncharacterized protein n=1 Tax=Amazonocrinis nigriterrae CENA67 TaxID=2794033 RepID=A0A8J7HS92_9NOST|nr:hypothetical protein [Amazonocrinis nigriterrae]MBH8561419.1 hypothetical protein [Amazonocrinis nigriterrae CENA67]
MGQGQSKLNQVCDRSQLGRVDGVSCGGAIAPNTCYPNTKTPSTLIKKTKISAI